MRRERREEGVDCFFVTFEFDRVGHRRMLM